MQTENRRKFLINFAYFAVILALAYLAFAYLLPAVSPFAIGFLVAYALRRPIRFVSQKLHLPWRPTALVLVLLFYGTVGLLLTLLSLKALSAIADLVGLLPQMYNVHILPFFTDVYISLSAICEELNLSVPTIVDTMGTQILDTVGSLASNASVLVMGIASGTVSALPVLFIELVLMIISSFFIAMDFEGLTGFCLRQLGKRGEYLFHIIKQYVVGTLWVCLRSYLIIMSITFVELSICLSVIKIEHAVLVAFCIAIFDILPVLGTGGIMLPWAALTAVKGDFGMGLALLCVYLIVTVIRNIIEPKIVGGQLGLHPVVTLVSMFVGVQFFGVIGLFGFPITLSLLQYLDEQGVIHIIKRKDEQSKEIQE